jgi:hypothetical protein
MPADLTREEIERLPGVLAEMESRLHFGGDPEDDRPATEVWSELWFCDADYMLVFKAARLALSEPTRLAAARAEGYREGVEAAIADAVAVSIRDEVDSYEMRDDGGGGYSPTDDERIMLEDFGAGLVAVFEQRLRALSPPPAEPSAPVAEGLTVKTYDPETGRTSIRDRQPPALPSGWVRGVQYLAKDGRGQWFYLNHAWTWQHCPPSDSPAERITALEAENAALREVVAAVAKHVEGMDLGGSEHDHVCYRVDLRTDLLRRARALLQGQGGGDA